MVCLWQNYKNNRDNLTHSRNVLGSIFADCANLQPLLLTYMNDVGVQIKMLDQYRRLYVRLCAKMDAKRPFCIAEPLKRSSLRKKVKFLTCYGRPNTLRLLTDYKMRHYASIHQQIRGNCLMIVFNYANHLKPRKLFDFCLPIM